MSGSGRQARPAAPRAGGTVVAALQPWTWWPTSLIFGPRVEQRWSFLARPRRAVSQAGGVGQGTVIRVAIVADIRLYREGLARVLERQPNISVVATAATGDGSLAPLAQLAPDLVLIDMAMADSLAAIQRVTVIAPGAKVVSLSVREADDDRDVLASAEAGAIAYVPREASLEDLVAVIECAVRGEAVCSPRVAGALLRRIAALATDGRSDRVPPHLTKREREIMGLIDAGLSNKEIAKRLRIEVATVKNHVHNILEKLQVHRRGEAAARVRAALPRRAVGSDTGADPACVGKG